MLASSLLRQLRASSHVRGIDTPTLGAALLPLHQADPTRRAQAPCRRQLPLALRGRAHGARRRPSPRQHPALPRRRRPQGPRAVCFMSYSVHGASIFCNVKLMVRIVRKNRGGPYSKNDHNRFATKHMAFSLHGELSRANSTFQETDLASSPIRGLHCILHSNWTPQYTMQQHILKS